MKFLVIAVTVVAVVVFVLAWLRRRRCPNCGRFARQPTGFFGSSGTSRQSRS